MEEQKIHWKKVFNSEYLGSCDLDEGKDLKVIIKSVVIKKVKNTDGKEQERNVALFVENIKPMVLNATNCKVIKKFAKSPYITDWNNIPVQIYVKDDIRAFGDVTEGLRIRETQPQIGKQQLKKGTPAWNNAIAYYKANGHLENVKARVEISAELEKELIKEASL
jgi:hypothetical protein